MGKLFGTDGVRGVANKELTPMLAFNLARASAYVLKKDLQKDITVVIGKDTRISGDMLEASSKSVANSAFKQSMDLNEQREYIIDLLYPFKDDIVIYHQGNHSFRLSKDYDYDIAKDMARELEVPYSMGGHIDKFKVNGKNYSIYTHHGKGSASRRDLAIGKIIRDTNKISANIFMVGHLHHAMVYKDYIKSSNGLEPRYYVYGGAFLNYKSSYADQMALNEVPPAFLIGNISKNHKIKWTEVDRIEWEQSTEYNGN